MIGRKPFNSKGIGVSWHTCQRGFPWRKGNGLSRVRFFSATLRRLAAAVASRVARVVLNCRAGGCVLEFLHRLRAPEGISPLAPQNETKGGKPSTSIAGGFGIGSSQGQFTTPPPAEVAGAFADLENPGMVNS